MKTSRDPRHLRRRATVRQLFSLSFTDQGEWHESEIAPKIWEKKGELDEYIRKVAVKWPPERLNKLDLAILRLAIFELLYDRAEPVKVIIDEAVEISKEFGSKSSASFVNGVLGKIVKEQNLMPSEEAGEEAGENNLETQASEG